MAGQGHRGRPGAVRKAKKGTKVGSGGKRRRGLEGKGPTPKAEDRVYHVAHKRKLEREEAARRAQPRLRASLQLAPDHELVVGRNPVAEAVAAGISYTRVFVVETMSLDERVVEVVNAAAAAEIPLVSVSRTEMDLLAGEVVHQGIALEVPPYEYVGLADLIARPVERAEEIRRWQGDAAAQAAPRGLIVALDSVTDPHNLGAVLRSAAAFRADGVLITARRSASVNATVWKVSAGAAARIPVAQETNLVQSLRALQEAGYFVVGLDGAAETAIADIPVADMPLVLVTGAEGAGLSRLVRETCDVLAAIPISSAAESLNAAVATGVSLYQIDQLRRAQR
ncbi:MAG: 23S rRNA (guanosine(2251)-2'-O)-methyltransferase RlmB [Trueperella sp.]|nr:23S rRNA (guanosine(2251)-2'-O)-methyltransferase RlmB [Trueperella sp.]